MSNGLFSNFLSLRQDNLPPPLRIVQSCNEIELEKEKVELEKVVTEERDLKTDSLNNLERRILIAINVYGLHDLEKASQWVGGITEEELINELKENQNIRNAIKNEEIACWTRAELIGRLCIEAESAPRAGERIAAVTKLMEFRGLATPEGGARSFTRTIARFRKSS